MRIIRGIAIVLLAPILPAQTVAPAEPARWSDQQKEDFLKSAQITRIRDLSVGVTGTKRLTLTGEAGTHDAHFQSVDIARVRYETAAGSELNFRDSYKFNIAAYRLDRMLNLRMTPVSVERRVAGNTGAITWWVDDVLMMESERVRKKIGPPDTDRWHDQIHQMNIFTQLIYNTDQNMTNLLITKDWTVWIIDFTRAFRLYKEPRDATRLVRIDRRLWNGLRQLSRDKLEAELSPWLGRLELDGIMARRDWIVDYLEKECARRGEAAVICDLSGH
jgi:hypothetical protein